MDGYKFMQFVKTALIGLTTFIAAGAFFVPFWFKFVVQIQVSTEEYVPVSINMGLFYMDQGTNIDMVDLVFLDKATNAMTFPPLFRVAQIFYGLGVTGTFVCFIASLIYTVRKYKTATGEMCLAGGMLPSALSLVIGVVFAALTALIEDDNSWEAFPVPSSYVQAKASPTLEISYGLYVAAFAALLGLISLAISWMQACTMCQHVENVRYQMLFAPLTEDERGVGNEVIHHFRPKPGFRYDGDMKPRREMDF